jgi:hypothetical protein
MESALGSLTPIIVILVVFLLTLVVVVFVVRTLRGAYLRKVTLDNTAIRRIQADMTDKARRASIHPGQEIDLAPFWRKSGIREPDRRAVIQPLIDNHVFGWYEYTSADAAARFFDIVGRLMWNPTRTKVIVSQWVRDDHRAATIVIEQVLGSVHFGDVDESTTYGDRAGRDFIGGDRVGGDKAGGDITKINAAGSVAGSANQGLTNFQSSPITTSNELSSALDNLASQAALRNESDDVVAALRWAATMAAAADGGVPDARDQAKHQRTLDRTSGWVRSSLSAMLQGVSGALASSWLVDLLRGQ